MYAFWSLSLFIVYLIVERYIDAPPPSPYTLLSIPPGSPSFHLPLPPHAGSANCFLYSLHPHMDTYYPTGYNDNYMYLQQNAQTLPNGLVSKKINKFIL